MILPLAGSTKICSLTYVATINTTHKVIILVRVYAKHFGMTSICSLLWGSECVSSWSTWPWPPCLRDTSKEGTPFGLCIDQPFGNTMKWWLEMLHWFAARIFLKESTMNSSSIFTWLCIVIDHLVNHYKEQWRAWDIGLRHINWRWWWWGGGAWCHVTCIFLVQSCLMKLLKV